MSNRKMTYILLLLPVLIVSFQNCNNSDLHGFNSISLSSSATTTTVSAFATKSVKLGWDQNADGATIGYKIYYGNQSGNYSHSQDVGSAGGANPEATISDLSVPATYYFVVVAYDSSNNESPASNEVSISF